MDRCNPTGNTFELYLKLAYHTILYAKDLVEAGYGDGRRDEIAVMEAGSICLATLEALGVVLWGARLKLPMELSLSCVEEREDDDSVKTAIGAFPIPGGIQKDQPGRECFTIPSRKVCTMVITCIQSASRVLSLLFCMSLQNQGRVKSSCGKKNLMEFGTHFHAEMREMIPCFSQMMNRLCIPWIIHSFNQQQHPEEESSSSALKDAKRAHWQLWDIASRIDKIALATKRPSLLQKSLGYRGDAIASFLLRTDSITALEENNNYFDSACGYAWKAVASHSSHLQHMGISASHEIKEIRDFHQRVGKILDDAVRFWEHSDVSQPYVEYCAWRATSAEVTGPARKESLLECDKENRRIRTSRKKKQSTLSKKHHHSCGFLCPKSCPFSQLPFLYRHSPPASEGEDEDPYSVILALFFMALYFQKNSPKQSQTHDNVTTLGRLSDHLTYQFQCHFLSPSQKSNPQQLEITLLKFHKLFSLLKLNTVAYKWIQEADSGRKSDINFSRMRVLSNLLEGCYAPMCVELARGGRSSPVNDLDRKKIMHYQDSGVEAYLKSAMLLERVRDHGIGDDSATTTKDDESFLRIIQTAYDLSLSHDGPMVEVCARTLASLGKKLSDSKERTPTALQCLILSIDLYTKLSTSSSSNPSIYQIPARYANLGSILQRHNLYKESIIAFGHALKYQLMFSSCPDIHTNNSANANVTEDLLLSAGNCHFFAAEKNHQMTGEYLGRIVRCVSKLIHDAEQCNFSTTISRDFDKVIQGSFLGRTIPCKESVPLLSQLYKFLLQGINISDESKINLYHEALHHVGKQLRQEKCCEWNDTKAYFFSEFQQLLNDAIASTAQISSSTVVAEARVYLSAAFALIPQGYTIQSRKKQQKSQLDLLLVGIARPFSSRALCMLRQEWDETTVGGTSSSLLALTRYISVGLFVAELFENQTNEASLDPNILTSYSDFLPEDNGLEHMSYRQLLSLCIKAVELLKEEDPEQTEITAIKIRQPLVNVLTSLYNHFFYEGAVIAAAHAAISLSFLEAQGNQFHFGEDALVSAAEALIEGELYDFASRLLHSVPSNIDRDIENLHLSDDKQQCPEDSYKNLNKTAVRALLQILSLSPSELSASIIMLESTLYQIECELPEEYFGRDISSSALSKNNERRISSTEEACHMLEILWTASTCILGLSKANEKMGNVTASFDFQQKNCNFCLSALKFTKMIASTKVLKNEILPSKYSLLCSFQWRWMGRLSSCLLSLSTIYSRLGDWRRSLDYAVASAETVNVSLPVEGGNQKNSDQMTSRQVASKRVYWEMKSLCGVPEDAVAKGDIMKDTKSCDRALHSVLLDLEDKMTDGMLRSESSSFFMDWKIEAIRAWITRGDITRYASEVDCSDKCYQRANELFEELRVANVSSGTKLAVDCMLRSRIEKKPIDCDSHSSLNNFGSLSSSINLRRGYLLNPNDSGWNLNYKVSSSPYATGIDLARAWYNLGLIALQSSRESGDLSRLWHGHSVYPTQSTHRSLNFGNATDKNNLPEHKTRLKNAKGKDILSPIEEAVHCFTKASSFAGPSSSLISRQILRSLALVTGPKYTNKCLNSKSAGILVHRSIGSTIRQLVSSAYKSSGSKTKKSEQPITPVCLKQLASEQKMESLYGALDTPDVNGGSKAIDDFLQEAAQVLPPDWNVVAATICPTGELLIASLQNMTATNTSTKSSLDSRIVCIFPHNENKQTSACETHNEQESSHFDEHILMAFDTLMERSLRTMSCQEKGLDDQKRKRQWWKERQDTDDQLRILLETVEEKYLSEECVRSIFLGIGRKADSSNDKVGDISNLSENFKAVCTISKNQNVPKSLKELPKSPVVMPLEGIDKIKKMTVVQIKKELEKLSVKKSTIRGLLKAGLVELLFTERRQLQIIPPPSEITSEQALASEESSENHHGIKSDIIENNITDALPCPTDEDTTPLSPSIILILDECLQRFPWEGIKMLEKKVVCRIPSLPFAIAPLCGNETKSGTNSGREINKKQYHDTSSRVDSSSVSYVLDPESNLPSTREKLQPVFESYLQWKGVVGEMPPDSFVETALKRKNSLFVYCGHGAGQCCFPKSKVQSLLSPLPHESSILVKIGDQKKQRCKSSVVLMGCSSGKLKSGETKSSRAIAYEPDGIALTYLAAGTPCVVGNLWDVTDRDIDRYTQNLLSDFFGCSSDTDRSIVLPQCVADARHVCKMRYIVGCAPVYYGLPVRCAKLCN